MVEQNTVRSRGQPIGHTRSAVLPLEQTRKHRKKDEAQEDWRPASAQEHPWRRLMNPGGIKTTRRRAVEGPRKPLSVEVWRPMCLVACRTDVLKL